MKTPGTQEAAIQEILKEKVLEFERVHSRLHETGPDPMRVDWSIMDKRIEDEVAATGRSDPDLHDFLYKFRRQTVRFIANVLNQHAMSGVKVDPKTFIDELEEFDPDGVMELSMECLSDIESALEKYAKGLGQLSVHLAGGEEADVV